MIRNRNLVAYRLAAFAGLVFGAFGVALAEAASYAPPAQMAHGQSPKPSAAHPSQAPNTPPAPATAPSLLDHPAQPAKITLTEGKLSVQANNSVLADILHEISKESGMKIDGLDAGPSADRRIFGTYGPGGPREVISDLLSDSDYNFLMLGVTSSGVPRQLALTARGGGATAGSGPAPNAAATASQEQNNPDEPLPAPQPEQPPNNPDAPQGPQNRIRTPQQMLQELQRMREQQQQEQQQDQPDQPDQPDQQPDQPN